MEQRPAHHIVLFGVERSLAQELQAALEPRDGPTRFVVTCRTHQQGLDPYECDLLIVDVDGQADDCLDLLARCRRLCSHLPAVVLVSRDDTATAVAAMKAGAADCLEKPPEPDRLLAAVTAALDNGRSSRRQTHRALTATEAHVLELLLAGETNLEIAERFHRSRRTVEVHRRNIMQKLGVSRISDLIKQASRMPSIRGETTAAGTPEEAPPVESHAY